MMIESAPVVITGERDTFQARFQKDDNARQDSLEVARQCAALTKPWLCPPKERPKDTILPENYQAIGSRGVNNLEGLMLLGLYSPDAPWFEIQPHATIMHDPQIPGEAKNAILNDIYQRELMTISLLESVAALGATNRRHMAFHSNKRSAIAQLIVTGDSLERMNPDYSITVFQRKNYVTSRDAGGNVRYHIARESIDLLTLTDDELSEVDFDPAKVAKDTSRDRMRDLYTFVEWHPRSKRWVIEHEINSRKLESRASEDDISPFFSTTYELAAEDNYGHGLVEQNLGDLRSLNNLMLNLLDFAATFSKILWSIDPTEIGVRPKDLEKRSGSVLRATTADGRPTKIGMIKADNAPQFSMVSEHAQYLNTELGKGFLVESEIQPQKERVTAEQVRRIALELEGALGGAYAPIAEAQQLQTVRRTLYQMERDQIFPKLPEGLIEIRALTGLAALRREHQRAKLLTIPQLLQNMPPNVAAAVEEKVDFSVLLDAAVRLGGIDIPGLIRSDEEVARRQQQRMAAQAQMEAQSKAIDVAGNVAEQAVAGQIQPEAA